MKPQGDQPRAQRRGRTLAKTSVSGSNMKELRQRAIKKLLSMERIATQGDLVESLRGEGIEATQATLSRDLAELGVLRVSRPEGAVYQLEPQGAPQLGELASNLVSIGENEALVVIRTRAGMASAVALAIDNARLPDCLGTLAGDDTIFATPVRATSARRLAQQIQHLFGKEAP